MARLRWTSHETLIGFVVSAALLKQWGWPVHSRFGELPKLVQTCLIYHDKSMKTAVLARKSPEGGTLP
jgi:hypothetical protein